MSFIVDEDLKEKLKKKWSNFRIDVEKFDFGPNIVQIETRIAREFLKTDVEELNSDFKALCTFLVEVCYEQKISE